MQYYKHTDLFSYTTQTQVANNHSLKEMYTTNIAHTNIFLNNIQLFVIL